MTGANMYQGFQLQEFSSFCYSLQFWEAFITYMQQLVVLVSFITCHGVGSKTLHVRNLQHGYPHTHLLTVLCTTEQVLLYDEPTAGLDPIASTVVEDLIRSVHMKGEDALGKPGNIASYVVVTHQHSTIRRAVDRLCFVQTMSFGCACC